MHVKCKICAFYGVKWVKTWVCVCKFFSKSCFSKKIFYSKSCFLKIIFSSKSCFLKKLFFFKVWRVVKILIQNNDFQIFFSDCCCIVIKVLPTCRFMPWCKKMFYECVAPVCLKIGTIFLLIVFIMALGFLMGVLTISIAIPIELYKSLWSSKAA